MSRRGFLAVGVFAAIAAAAGTETVLALRYGFSARDEPTAVETIAARTARKLALPRHARQMRNPLPQTPENLAKGMEFWAQSCATCHGNDGSGRTAIGLNVYPKAPDLSLPATQNLTDGELYFTIVNGIRLTAMPAWGPPRGSGKEESNEEIWRAVQFIRHLPQLTPDERREMRRMNERAEK